MTPEQALSRDVRRVLGARTDLVLHTNPVGAGYAGSVAHALGELRLSAADRAAIRRTLNEHRIRWGLCPGSSDLIAIVAPRGRLAAVELKSERGRLRPEQEAWLARMRALGAVAGEVRSVEEAETMIAEAQRGAPEGSEREAMLQEENARLYALAERLSAELAEVRAELSRVGQR
jgi:hypothetical protein